MTPTITSAASPRRRSQWRARGFAISRVVLMPCASGVSPSRIRGSGLTHTFPTGRSAMLRVSRQSFSASLLRPKAPTKPPDRAIRLFADGGDRPSLGRTQSVLQRRPVLSNPLPIGRQSNRSAGCGDWGRRENYPSYGEISPENKESGSIRVLLASLFLTDLEERGTLIQTPSRVRLTNAWEITPPMLCPSTLLPLLAASRSVALSV